MDLLTTYTNHSEIQVISALSLICTIHRSSQHIACRVFSSHSLATASNSGDSSASHAQVLPVQRISSNRTLSIINSAITLSVLSLPCRAQLNCQPPTELDSESQLLYANQFVSAPSPLRLTANDFFFN
jgi:hypothetical protein